MLVLLTLRNQWILSGQHDSPGMFTRLLVQACSDLG